MYLTIQYLEDITALDQKTPAEWAEGLDQAFHRLPITHVLVGWQVPAPILQALDNSVSTHYARLYRWHPLLTGDGVGELDPSWRVIGLDGNPVPAVAGRMEFSFICPNNPGAVENALTNLTHQLSLFNYQGVFLDRIRFPSPAADPARHLGCFCEHCQEAAATAGLDLEAIRRELIRQVSTPVGLIDLVLELAGLLAEDRSPLSQLLAFRQESITRVIRQASNLALERGFEVGLDCFSPLLARLVGQDLVELSYQARWMKIMTYAHTYAPAGLPYEIHGLIGCLVHHTGLSWAEAAGRLNEVTGLPIPEDEGKLIQAGFPGHVVEAEVANITGKVQCPVLPGIELVDLRGITRIHDESLEPDLRSLVSLPVEGLALSWDLRHIPLNRLEMVSRVLSGGENQT